METEEHSKSRELVAAPPSHIIERPRLIKLMEDSGARVIVLNAPAGYGKTTLARQWAADSGREATWYRCTAASADIAVLAGGLAAVLARVIPGAGAAMQKRIRSAADPAGDVGRLVELLTESLVSWPPNAWLVVDDHHLLSGSTASEALFEAVVLDTPVQILATSRLKPRWASTRRILYGEVLDLDRSSLAFTFAETGQILQGGPTPFTDLAQGWPAVVALASRLGRIIVPSTKLPAELYDFLAEELFQQAPDELRAAVVTLAVCPSFDARTLDVAFVDSDWTLAVSGCEDVGFLQRTREGDLEMHPLLRSFLVEKIKLSRDARPDDLAERLALDLVARKRFDDAYTLQLNFPNLHVLISMLEVSLDHLLDAGRVETVIHWLELADTHNWRDPMIDLAAAKVAFRRAEHPRAETLAASAADMLPKGHPARPEALITAGLAAMMGDRTPQARQFFGEARSEATTDRHKREALMGDFFSSLELEHPDATEILKELEHVDQTDPQTKLRLATARLLISATAGSIESAVADALPMTHLVERVDDPHTTTSFLYALAGMAALSAHYVEALAAAQRALRIAEELGVEFAVPHAKIFIAASQIGLRRYGSAATTLQDVDRWARLVDNVYVKANARVFRARLLLMQGMTQQVLTLLPVEGVSTQPPGLIQEQRMIRALALACDGSLEDAVSETDAAQSSRAEGTTLRVCARAVVHLQSPSLTGETPEDAYAVAAATGNFDSFVCAYRAFPELIRQLSQNAAFHERLATLLARASDLALASRLGLASEAEVHGTSLLTVREGDVFRLLCEGLSNQQIADALFLSRATVKVHLRHIYAKLGVKNRTQATLQARGR